MKGIDLLPNGGINESAQSGTDGDYYYFDLMLGFQDGFLYPITFGDDGVALYLDKDGIWCEDDSFPYDKYNAYLAEKMEESIDE